MGSAPTANVLGHHHHQYAKVHQPDVYTVGHAFRSFYRIASTYHASCYLATTPVAKSAPSGHGGATRGNSRRERPAA